MNGEIMNVDRHEKSLSTPALNTGIARIFDGSAFRHSYICRFGMLRQWDLRKLHFHVSGGTRKGPAGACAPAGKGCAPADEVGQN